MLFGTKIVIPVDLLSGQDNSVITVSKKFKEKKNLKKYSNSEEKLVSRCEKIQYCVSGIVSRFQPQQLLGT